MDDLIRTISDKATDAHWTIESIPKNILKRSGFEHGVTLTSPCDNFTLEVMDSKHELFCNFGSYGRIETTMSPGDKRDARKQVLSAIECIFMYGIVVERYTLGGKTLRSIVTTGPENNRRTIAKSVNGIGLIGGHKEELIFAVPRHTLS